MTKYPELFVLRHGQTEWNLAGRHQGRMNSDLTALGREQAVKQGKILQVAIAGRDDVVAITSPQGRAFDTAVLALEPVGITPLVDDRLCEIAFGEWEGLTFDDIAAGWPEKIMNADTDVLTWHFRAPGGESFETVRSRAVSFLESLTGPTIIVTHGITSRVLRGLWLGGDWDEMAALPGGQGCVYHLADGQHNRLD